MTNQTENHEDRVQAANWALETLRKLGRSDLIDHLTIDWKEAFTARMGDACYLNMRSVPAGRRIPRKIRKNIIDGICARVRFSSVLWPRATEKERYETVVHEVCHLVANHEAFLRGSAKPQAHGAAWKRVMLRAGVRPERCHNVDRSGLKRKSRKTEVAHCKCREHNITPNMAAKIHRGALYYCRSCHTYIKNGPLTVAATTAKTSIQGFVIPTPKALGF